MKNFAIYIICVVVAATGCARHLNSPDEVPVISVGIMEADSIIIAEVSPEGETITNYRLGAGDVADSLIIVPANDKSVFRVDGVTIGIGFHWQQKETQCFEGNLRVLRQDSLLVLINDIDIERYLESVISSEMSADAPNELLRAHAIASRSWLLSQINGKHSRETRAEMPGEVTVWYDRDDHRLFDVCADDHCQRYQGVTRRTNNRVNQAVRDTRGMILTVGDTVCDARFSKCCGGVTEEFENCWEPTHFSYLEARRDDTESLPLPDLKNESAAIDWIEGRPDAFCANPGTDVLATLLNSYDRATADYYRWTVKYRADSLGMLIAHKSGYNLGYIKRLEPLTRGTSGRITRLRIVGDRDSIIIGKELEIRRTLSPSHLYSSAFTVTISNEGPDALISIQGAGWGHGVGMCQIGAAVMATKGYKYNDILTHYFPGATITQAWKD